MKFKVLILLIFTPFLSDAQSTKGTLSAGVQLYQNIMLPEGYQGFGSGANVLLDIAKGIGVNGTFFYETNDLQNAGSIKRFQRGLALNYVPLYSKKLSPWIQVGTAFNTINVQPVSYLFADNSSMAIEQNYFSLNIGIGGIYHATKNLTLNTGIYFQPQNYKPNYFLESSESGSILQTNIVSINPQVAPLVYFNIGFTYKIAKLW